VYPPGYDGQKQEPAFTGLLAAYYTGSSHSDNFNTFPPRVQPGDAILDVFVKVSPPGPDPRTIYKPSDFDFQLRAGSAAVDAGVRLPGVNDDFTGRAPDLGAYEVGRPLAHYGPRP
jgi:hypothetical protein